MSVYFDYLTYGRHQDFLREAEEARLRRLVRNHRKGRLASRRSVQR